MDEYTNERLYDIRFIRPCLQTPFGPVIAPFERLGLGPLCVKFAPHPICRVRGEAEGRYLKGRSEVLILRENRLFLTTKKAEVCCMNGRAGMRYAVPGGGWSKGEAHWETARREAEEEAGLKTTSMVYAANYIELMASPRHSSAGNVPRRFQWRGYYTEVFLAEYDGVYSGPVDWQDRDRRIRSGGFYPLEEVFDRLHPAHKEAIRAFKEG